MMASCKGCQDPKTTPLDWVKCYGYTPRLIDDSDVTAYAQRGGAVGTQLHLAQACLLAGRLMYAKQCPGDCPQETKINLGAAATAKKVAGIATTALGLGSALGLTALAATGPIALAIAPIAIWATISAHHKIAVAREQATICDVTQAYNSYADTVEYGISNGATTVLDAKNALPGIEQQLLQSLQAIVKGGCNAACFYQKALRSLNLYSLEKQYDALNPKNTTNPANPAWALASLKKSKLSEYALAGVGSFGVVKLAGVLL